MAIEQRTFGLVALGCFIGALLAVTYAVAKHGPSGFAASSELTHVSAQTEAFNRKIRCAEIGMQWADTLKKDAISTGQSFAQPRFAYNAELNTCIIRAGFLDVKSGKLYQFLADSLTEETLIDLSDNDPVKQANFKKAEMRLMGPPESEQVAEK